MWRKSYEKRTKDEQKFTIIYFDAFRYDYYEDPFIAISGAITEKLTAGNAKRLADKAAVVSKKAFPSVLKAFTKALLKKGGIDDAILQELVSDLS
jgi:hypothetical protein